MIVDGKYDEELNIHPCNFDGGDCCTLEETESNCHEYVHTAVVIIIKGLPILVTK